MGGIRSNVRRLFRLRPRTPGAADEDADAELQAFIDARIEHLIARGMTPAEARTEAESRLGGSIENARTSLHRSARRRTERVVLAERLANVRADIRYAVRSLRRDPLVTAFIIVTLALGIGANAAMFGVVDRLLLKGPEHVREHDRVMRLYSTTSGRTGPETTAIFGYVTYGLLATNARSLEGVAAYQVNDGTMGRGTEARPIVMGRATWSFFPLLGVQPTLGRWFTADEDSPAGAARVAVLGYDFWQRTFAGEAHAIGATIVLNDESYLVIGVAPRGFTGVSLSAVDVWTPVSLHGAGRGAEWATAWYWTSLRVIARLKPGVTAAHASDEATTVHANGYTGTGPLREAKHDFRPASFTDEGREPATLAIARWLMAVSAIVLLVACANVVNLLLARSARRDRELAVRRALGAGRGRLARLLLAEGLLLALAAGAASLAVAWLLGRLMRVTLLTDVTWTSPTVDVRVLGTIGALALVCGVVVGLLPAVQASRPDLTDSLNAAARIGGVRRSRLRSGLTLGQAALSVLLLTGAGLFVRSVRQLDALPLGIDAERVLAVSINPPRQPNEQSAAWMARREEFVVRVLERVRREPGVERATVSIGIPFGSYYGVMLYIPGRDSIPALPGGNPRIHGVGKDYFRTVGTPMLRGRAFTAADHDGAERVVIVSDRIARAFWPGEDALEKCIVVWKATEPCARVVGIAANTFTREVSEQPGLQFYVPVEQAKFGGIVHLLVRPAGDPEPMVAPLRRALLETDSTLAYLDIRSLRERLDPQLRPWRLGMAVFTMFGILAAIVSAAGLYGLAAYLVTTRIHEIGVRMALGATSARVAGQVLRSSIAIASGGVALGLIAALLAGRFLEPLLFRTSARDPRVIVAVGVLMLGVAVVAAVVPAVRASRIAPASALRSD
jgi:predicted permease